MTNRYIINKNYYIQDNLDSFLLYFDFFSQGITLPKYLSSTNTRKISHILLRNLIILMYLTKVYTLLYKRTHLNETAYIVIYGNGKWGSVVKLIKFNNSLKIVKQVKSKKIFVAEKKFYSLYKNNSTKIKLPMCTFHKDNIIEMEFLFCKSLQRLILDGTYSLSKTIDQFKILRDELQKLYKNKPLTHGDMWPGNIYIKDNTYYLIDFSDSTHNNPSYDIYTLLHSILSTFNLIKIDEKNILNFTFNYTNVKELLNTKVRIYKLNEKKYINYRNERFPGVYYN